MSSRERLHGDDKAHAKRQPPKRETGGLVTSDREAHPAAIIQRASLAPGSLSRNGVMRLQRAIGNQAVGRLLAQESRRRSVRQTADKTGLPDQLKRGVENLAGVSLDEVRVHYNSSKPSRLQALAYTQGTDIHLAPGQERHLAHEAWHTVQQMRGQVRPTPQAKGVVINDERGLEAEADVMGAKAEHVGRGDSAARGSSGGGRHLRTVRTPAGAAAVQRVWVDAGAHGLQKWDEEIEGVTWYWNPTTQRMFHATAHGKTEEKTYEQWLAEAWPGTSNAGDVNKLYFKGLQLQKEMEAAVLKSQTERQPFLPREEQERREKAWTGEYQQKVEGESGEITVKTGHGAEYGKALLNKQSNYLATVDVSAGMFKAQQSERFQGLNQNEVIYQQWRLAESAASGESGRMTHVVRKGIVNKTLEPVMRDMKRRNNGTYEGLSFSKPDRMYYVLLGTPNIAAETFLVKERGFELRLTGIRSIELTAKGDAVVRFDLA